MGNSLWFSKLLNESCECKNKLDVLRAKNSLKTFVYPYFFSKDCSVLGIVRNFYFFRYWNARITKMIKIVIRILCTRIWPYLLRKGLKEQRIALTGTKVNMSCNLCIRVKAIRNGFVDIIR